MSGVGYFVMLETLKMFNQILEETIQQSLAALPQSGFLQSAKGSHQL
jgi:hypothetical protein